MRLIAAALAIALLAALPIGDNLSSEACESPISIPFIFKSPIRSAGRLKAELNKFSEVTL